jgi:hypothetical protein
MHSYSIRPSGKREQTTLIIVFIAIVVYVIVRLFKIGENFGNIIDTATNGVASEYALVWELLIYAFSIIVPISFYAILVWIYSNWLWKHLCWLHKIPNLSGYWTGYLKHGYIIVGKNKKKIHDKTEIEVRIKQNWDKISIITETNNYKANSRFAEIRIDDNGDVYLKYVFDCYETKTGEKKYHQGYNELLFYNNKLEGEFFTNRDAHLEGKMKYYKTKVKKVEKGFGTKGYISLERK